MAAVRPALLTLSLASFASLASLACSTAPLSVSPFDDDEDVTGVDAARPLPQPDAARPFPTPDAAMPAPRLDASAPPSLLDAGRPLPPRDAGSPPTMDAQPPRGEFDAASLWPTGQDAAVTCAIHNQAACPVAFDTRSPCNGIDAPYCAYPEPAPNTYLLRSCTGDGPGRLNLSVTRVQCPHDCFREIPSSFEGLNTSDCASRPVVRCDSFPTNQLAVDLSLQSAALACGLKTHHLGLMFDEQGCARALFGREIRDPAIRCIGKILNGQRFSCAPQCAVANSDL